MSSSSALLAAAIALLAETTQAAEPGFHFEAAKSFASEREYRQSLGRPFRLVEPGKMVFYDQYGKEGGSVSLTPEVDGYERIALQVKEANIIFRLWRGYEAAAGTLEIYRDTVQSKATWNLPSLEFGIFPDGAAILVAGKRPDAHYGGYNGDVAVISSTGAVLSTNRTGNEDRFPQFTFSEDGHLAAVISGQIRFKTREARSSIVMVKSSGEEIGRYESSDWLPQSGDIALRPRYYNVPLARIDEVNRMVVATGYEIADHSRYLAGISFEGKSLWRWRYKDSPRDCKWTLVKKPSQARVVVVGLCRSQLLLTDLNIKTGEVVKEVSMEIPDANTDFAEGFESAQDGQVILNISRQAKQTLRSCIVLDNDLQELWREEFSEKSPGEFFMGPDRMLAFRQDDKVKVGRFVP